MPPILNAQGLTKAFGATALFREISFTVSDGDRIGLIGPNGAGKSTLLKVLAGDEDADAGDVAVRKRARVGYVQQESSFAPGMTVRAVLEAALVRARVAEGEHEGRLRETSGRIGFPELNAEAATLSGGWRKRLAIAEAVVTHPDVLLLDEPTNHLDLAGIVWLEELLNEGSFACVLVSHDRYFLENVATEIVELNRVYADGWLRVRGSYSRFFEGKQAYVEAQTKRLVELENVSVVLGDRKIVEGLNFLVTSGMRVGLVGPNGSGKTTLLRLLTGELEPTAGTIKRAAALKIVYFSQMRELEEGVTLRRALAPDSDSVVYQGRVVHVASYATKFLFTSEQLNQPVERLSGGERARVLIAKLMLEPADLLLLDEPTNDLDIATLAILEESLLEYTGALVLVTHDRYMLDRVSTVVLGLDGRGGAEMFADYSQWEQWRGVKVEESIAPGATGKAVASVSGGPASNAGGKKKLSYLEAREFAGIEAAVEAAEERLQKAREMIENPAVAV